MNNPRDGSLNSAPQGPIFPLPTAGLLTRLAPKVKDTPRSSHVLAASQGALMFYNNLTANYDREK